jgi:prevent-host-death family protein
MYVMDDAKSDNTLSIRDLQRNAAEVMTQVANGRHYVITRHGRTVGRLLPPEPGQDAINQAIAEGILDAGDLAHARTARQVADLTPEPTADPAARPATDALARMRAEER